MWKVDTDKIRCTGALHGERVWRIGGWHLGGLRCRTLTAQHLSFESSGLEEASDCASFWLESVGAPKSMKTSVWQINWGEQLKGIHHGQVVFGVCVCVHFIIAEHYSGTATDELGMIGSFHSNQSQSRNWNEAATWLPASSEADNQLWMLRNNEWKKTKWLLTTSFPPQNEQTTFILRQNTFLNVPQGPQIVCSCESACTLICAGRRTICWLRTFNSLAEFRWITKMGVLSQIKKKAKSTDGSSVHP